ncbi:MAG: Uma2 family endonuclease [Ardenticatenales bacterium]|nr:Uma2 family endonuclease [Ardenticatenales bacterium]
MAIPQTVTLLTPEEYLAEEALAEFKHEYMDGVVVAMSGGSRYHSCVIMDLGSMVNGQLRGSDCQPFESNLRVRTDANHFVYPDVTVVCGETQFSDDGYDNLLNPTVIFEVLSPSTEAHDRGAKWFRYRQMPSLQQYVLVSQDRPQIEVFTRNGDVWTYIDVQGLDASLQLDAIGVTLALGDVYARVKFDEDRAVGLIGEPGD